jgi:hypothetical protein
MRSDRNRQILQVAENVRRDKSPQFRSVALANGVQHAVVGPREQHRCTARVTGLERVVLES